MSILLNSILNYNFGLKTKVLPKTLCIETTNHCNLRCSMCNHRFMSRPKTHMTFKLFKKIIDDIQHHPYITCIELQMWGEPLLNPDIFKMIRYARNKIRCVKLSTNGLLLDDDVIKRLLTDFPDHLRISIDATTKETYDKIRCNGDFDKVVTNTKRFLEQKGKGNKPHTVVQMIEMKHNRYEIEKFKSFWKDYADEVSVIRLSSMGNPKNRYDINKVTTYDSCKVPFCGILWNRMCIYSNGDVPFCFADYDGKNLLGDISDENIIDIWNSDKINHLRNNFRHNKSLPKECYDCNEQDMNGTYDLKYLFHRVLTHLQRKISSLS